MLKTRVITALVLVAVLLAVLFSDSYPVFVLVAAAFFAAAAWESFRLFNSSRPALVAALWTAAFGLIAFSGGLSKAALLCALCIAIWVIRLAPSLGTGLPGVNGVGNQLLTGVYGVALLGCFVAIAVLFRRSPVYLVSVMAIVWVADIGAYFAGKAFGKHKLAPSISPGKTWEGAVGGWLAVLALAAVSTALPQVDPSFALSLRQHWGWAGMVAVMTLMVAASIVGDLFESQLKRRAGAKDSSSLLPGHGGVLDRIDALIPALPLAVLFDTWLNR